MVSKVNVTCGEIDIQIGAKPISLKGEINMEIYKNAIETKRAFILFSNIQHISWIRNQEIKEYETKIYSNAGVIIQPMTQTELTDLLINYKECMGVKFHE